MDVLVILSSITMVVLTSYLNTKSISCAPMAAWDYYLYANDTRFLGLNYFNTYIDEYTQLVSSKVPNLNSL